MSRLYLVSLVSLYFIISCTEQRGNLLNEISGVWRARQDGTMISFVYTASRLRLLIGDSPVDVTLGEIDQTNKTVNLNIRLNTGRAAIWTVRQIWDASHQSFHLQLTLHDGGQDELSFVRKISTDDST